ncbi:MAG: hypothetical protein HYZ37_10070 [Candidatus Solibacter usitatus]|nr:hypothetical protein [Candidatus Solibacter usitatus]
MQYEESQNPSIDTQGYERAKAISTGLCSVDALIGAGGLPRGHIIEVYGPPSCGKTTLGLNWIAAAQGRGCNAVLVDAEHSFDAAWASQAGVNSKELVLVQPENGEQVRPILDQLLRTFSVDLVVLDSAAALNPISGPIVGSDGWQEDPHVHLLFQLLHRMKWLVQRTQAAFVILNQSRTSGIGENAKPSSAGARALNPYTSVRIQLNSGPALKHYPVRELTLRTVKNKFAEPFAQAAVELWGAKAQLLQRKPPAVETRHGSVRQSERA